MRISLVTPQEFYTYSKEFINNVIEEISRGAQNVVLDQFMLPFNMFRIDNYFDDNVRAIVVERDPRDVFILNKYIWGERQIRVPVPLDVKMFCQYYRKMRKSEKVTGSNKVLRIKFEDLIYKYDDTLTSIMEHLNFTEQDHINKKTRFDPDISIKNTQLFNNPIYEQEVKIIENELKEYIYNFPYSLNNEVENTVEFDD